MRKTGAEIFVECLLREGVDTIFGHPGGAVLKIYDALYDAPIRHILTRHEQAAVHAADGYARATGKPGVCLVTSGPGATNCVTGLATANMDSIPVVVFTGQVPTGMIGDDAFQEADILGITFPCVKHSDMVRRVEKMAQTIREAFYIARTGKPGPVLIDLPKDVLMDETEFLYPEEIKIRGYNPTYVGHPGQIRKAVDALAAAKRPVLYAGGGVISSGGAAELRELAEITVTPTTTTLMGLGGFPTNHPLFLGMLGMHGTYRANMSMCEADLIVAIGARFDDRVTGKLDEFAPKAKIIHIDIDPSCIGKNVTAHIPIVGDVKTVLGSMNRLLREVEKDWAADHREWLELIAEWERTYPLTYLQRDDVIKPQYVIEQIDSYIQGKNAIVATGVGQHQMWAAQYLTFTQPRTWLTSGGLGTMGYCLPAAMGAQAAFPQRLVLGIDGDASFQMNIQELATVAQYQLPVKIAVMNNYYLGMVRQWQEIFYNKRYSHSYMGPLPDLVKVAEAYKVTGLRAERPEEVGPVIERALNTKGPVIIDFVVDPDENVFPMVPAGAPIREMLLA
ncbi:MAG: biosynthetic-type acetolactate synthase large subunit [Nitrospinota bacterium]|nr:MAG: biosynthetic-type acetolactate synthase large subunit [Nitrospinota bacterium]